MVEMVRNVEIIMFASNLLFGLRAFSPELSALSVYNDPNELNDHKVYR
jgi:hypothetical protein